MTRLCGGFAALLIMMPVFTAGAAPANSDWEEIFFKANQAYKENDFQKAIEGYSHLIRSGYQSANLYYNLGNAYFKTDQLGRAILEYERAFILMPRDADLNFNLTLARDETRDAISPSRGFVDKALFWLGSFNLAELFWGFAVSNALFWLVLFVRLFRKSEWTYYVLLGVLILWLLTGISFGFKWFQVENDNRVVVLQEEVNVLAGPDIHDTVLFKLHEGTIVRRERAEDGWLLLRLPDKKRGWVQADQVAAIRIQDHPSDPGD